MQAQQSRNQLHVLQHMKFVRHKACEIDKIERNKRKEGQRNENTNFSKHGIEHQYENQKKLCVTLIIN